MAGVSFREVHHQARVGEDRAGDPNISEPFANAYSCMYEPIRVVGKGTFGVVELARAHGTGQLVAIKTVLYDDRLFNRELNIMKTLLMSPAECHPNIVRLLHYFVGGGDRSSEARYLNLVMEYLPLSVYEYHRQWLQQHNTRLPLALVKTWGHQLCRALSFLHHPSRAICHRDIKPQNLMVNPENGELKLCDFGSAKKLVAGEKNVSYICSRYYRAPELLFGSLHYDFAVDMWAFGCVLAELLLGRPLFRGVTTVDQTAEIFKLLGTPSQEDIAALNPQYTSFDFPEISPVPLRSIFPPEVPQSAVDLLSSILCFNPRHRLTATETLSHPFFESLNAPSATLFDGAPLPETLFTFTASEIQELPEEFISLWRRSSPPTPQVHPCSS